MFYLFLNANILLNKKNVEGEFLLFDNYRQNNQNKI